MINFVASYLKLAVIYFKCRFLDISSYLSAERNILTLIKLSLFYGAKKENKKIVKKIDRYTALHYSLAPDLVFLKYFKCSFKNMHYFHEALEKGRGLFLASISFSLNLELGFFLAAKGYKVNFVFNEESSLDGYKKSIRKYAVDLFPKPFHYKILNFYQDSSKNYGTLTELRRALKDNEIVIFLVDFVNNNNKSGGYSYRFLDIPYQSNIGLFDIARKFKVPLVPVIAVNHFFCRTKITFAPAVDIMEGNVQPVFDFLGSYIKKYPGMWLNWHSLDITPERLPGKKWEVKYSFGKDLYHINLKEMTFKKKS